MQVNSLRVGSNSQEKLDDRAKRIVLDAYQDACREDCAGPRDAFEAALASYLTAYPHVGKELAGHAVAHILATAETYASARRPPDPVQSSGPWVRLHK